MRNVIASVLQAVGVVGVVAGGFLVSVGVGVLCLSVVALVAGVLVDR